MKERIYAIEYKFLNGRDPRILQIICPYEKVFVEWCDELLNDPEVCVVDMWYVESNKHRLTLTEVHAMKREVYEHANRFAES